MHPSCAISRGLLSKRRKTIHQFGRVSRFLEQIADGGDGTNLRSELGPKKLRARESQSQGALEGRWAQSLAGGGDEAVEVAIFQVVVEAPALDLLENFLELFA